MLLLTGTRRSVALILQLGDGGDEVGAADGGDVFAHQFAIGHQRNGLERIYNFDEAWQLRCEAFAKVSEHVARLLGCATDEGKVVAIPARTY